MNATDLPGVLIHYGHYFDPDGVKSREAVIGDQ